MLVFKFSEKILNGAPNTSNGRWNEHELLQFFRFSNSNVNT